MKASQYCLLGSPPQVKLAQLSANIFPPDDRLSRGQTDRSPESIPLFTTWKLPVKRDGEEKWSSCRLSVAPAQGEINHGPRFAECAHASEITIIHHRSCDFQVKPAGKETIDQTCRRGQGRRFCMFKLVAYWRCTSQVLQKKENSVEEFIWCVERMGWSVDVCNVVSFNCVN